VGEQKPSGYCQGEKNTTVTIVAAASDADADADAQKMSGNLGVHKHNELDKPPKWKLREERNEHPTANLKGTMHFFRWMNQSAAAGELPTNFYVRGGSR